MKKITQRELPYLESGTYQIERQLYFRKRGGYGSFFLRVQVNGERHDVSIGSSKDVTIAMAKAKAVRLRAQIADGAYPWAEKKKKEKHLLGEVLGELVETVRKRSQWKNEERTLTDWMRTFEIYVLPTLGKKDVADIDLDDVLSVIENLWYEHPMTAVRIRWRFETLLSIAILRGWRTAPNCAVWKGNLDAFLPDVGRVHEVKHRKAITMEEARRIAMCFRFSKITSHKAILFGLLTCARVSEFSGAKWEEIDWENKVWSCPPERMKVRRADPHRVPLAWQTMEFLRRWRKEGKSVYIFPQRSGLKPISHTLPLNAMKTHVGEGATMHGCRATFSTWGAEHNHPMELVEMSLAHKVGSEVRRAYQRSDLLELRRPIMQAWADDLFSGDWIDKDHGTV